MGRRFLTLVACLVWAGHAAAQTSCGTSPCPASSHCLRCPPVGCCPNDYTRKPLPLICPLPPWCGPNDYERKPLPWLCELFRCGGCDDYYRKPLPTLLCPSWSPYLQCGPPECCCPPGRR